MSKTKASSNNSSSISSTNAAAAAAVGAGLTMPNRTITPTPTPTTTTTTTTTATTSHQEQQPTTTTAAVIYPVASSGRGFLSTNHHPCRPPVLPYHPHHFPNPNPSPRPLPPPLPHPHTPHFPLPPPHKPLPLALHPKVAPSPSPHSETNGYKNVRDRTKDDSLVTVRGRKVRIIDGASLYALCRSWVRNGFPDETQPQYGDVIKSLPQPLPIPVTDNVPKDTGVEEEQEEKAKQEDEPSVENLSAQDLLKRHVDQAKRVRSRLRDERLRRIARYKTRLALLLPPLVEQFRNDAAAGN